MNYPTGLTVHLIIADFRNHRIQSFQCDGTFVFKWGSFGIGDGKLIDPMDVTIESKNRIIFVVDQGNHRIQSFRHDGSFVCKWGSYGDNDGQFDYPCRLHYCKYDDLIYVADCFTVFKCFQWLVNLFANGETMEKMMDN